MAQRLTSMSVDALINLRNEIGAVLNRKAEFLKKELAALGSDYGDVVPATKTNRNGKHAQARKYHRNSAAPRVKPGPDAVPSPFGYVTR